MPRWRTFPCCCSLKKGFDHSAVFELLSGRIAVDLDHVEVTGPEPAETLVDPGRHVLPGIDVRLPAVAGAFYAHLAGALRSKNDVGSSVLQGLTDQLLAQSVIDGGVDVIDPEVDHLVYESNSVALTDRACSGRTCQFHGPVTEPADDEIGTAHAPCPTGQRRPTTALHAFPPLATTRPRSYPVFSQRDNSRHGVTSGLVISIGSVRGPNADESSQTEKEMQELRAQISSQDEERAMTFVRVSLLVLGILSSLIGLVWVGQGTGYFPYPSSSFMINQMPWVCRGIVLAVLGLTAVAVSSQINGRHS